MSHSARQGIRPRLRRRTVVFASDSEGLTLVMAEFADLDRIFFSLITSFASCLLHGTMETERSVCLPVRRPQEQNEMYIT